MGELFVVAASALVSSLTRIWKPCEPKCRTAEPSNSDLIGLFRFTAGKFMTEREIGPMGPSYRRASEQKERGCGRSCALLLRGYG